MKGFGSVFVQEWVLLKHNTTWWAILGLLLVLTVLAALNGAASTDQRAEMGAGLNQGELQTQTALQSAVARWEANPEGDPPSVASPGALGL